MGFNFRHTFDRALTYQPFLAKHATPEQRERWQRLYDAAVLTGDQQALLASFRRKMHVLVLAGPWCGDCVNACPIFQRIAEASRVIDLRFINRAQPFAEAAALPRDSDDIRNSPLGKILVKWGVLTPERVEKALLMQEEQKAQGLNVRIGDILTREGFVTEEQRDKAVAAQQGYESLDEWDVAVAKEVSICGAPRVPVLVFLSEDWFECERYGERTLATYRDKVAKLAGASCPTGLFAPPKDLLAANIAEWLTHFERVQWMLMTSPRLMKAHGEV